MKKFFTVDDFFADGSFICHENNAAVGFIAAKLSKNILPEYADAAWISLFAVKKEFQNKGIGTKLLSLCEEALKKKSVKKVFVSQDFNNFFAGIPEPEKNSEDFFRNHGFAVAEEPHWDLCNDLSVYPLECHTASINMTDEYKTAAADETDIPAIKEFMESEFPGRWDFEISGLFKSDALHHILLLKHAGEIKGFCRVRLGFDTDGLEFYLGENCGALGPIGIAKDIRKLGLGKRILFDSLKFLKDSGAHKTNIDWTELKDFYGTFGFTPWRTYLGAYKIF
jgi:GNAT superfamily N-acetyltransferase